MTRWKWSHLLIVAFVLLVTGISVKPNAALILTPLFHLQTIAAALCIVAVSFPIGAFLLRRILSEDCGTGSGSSGAVLPAETFLFATALGMGVISTLMFLLASVQLYSKTAAVVLLAILALSGRNFWRPWIESLRNGDRRTFSRSPMSLLLAITIVLSLCFALLPTTSYDALEYHLGAQSEYIRHGGFTLLPYNVYANFPMGVEMLYGLGLLFGGEGVPHVLHCLFALLAAMGIFCTVGRLTESATDSFSPTLLLATPLVMLSCGMANIDLALVFYSSLTVLALVAFPTPMNLRQIFLIGILGGLSLAAKYTAVVQVCFPAALALVVLHWTTTSSGKRSLDFKQVGVFGLGVVLPFVHWMIKNYVLQGNPFFPLAYRLFGGRFWSEEAAVLFRNAHAPRLQGTPLNWLSQFATNLHQLVGGENTPGLGVIAVGLLLALLRKPSRRSVALWIYAISSFAGWFLLTHWQDRFLLPLLPAVIALATEAFYHAKPASLKRLAGASLIALLLINLWFGFAVLCHGNAFEYLSGKTDLLPWRSRGLPHFQAMDFMNEFLDPQSDRVLFVGEARTHGNLIPVVASTVFDRSPFLEITQGHSTAENKAQALRNEGFTHILYNGYEIRRLHETYAPYGWQMAPAIETAMRELAPVLKDCFHTGHPGLDGITLYQLSQ